MLKVEENAASHEMLDEAERRNEEVEMLRSELVRLRGQSEGSQMEYDPSRGLRPAMTLLDRFAAVRREIGIDQACNMLQTIELARKLLGVQVWSDSQSLPEQVCDQRDSVQTTCKPRAKPRASCSAPR